MAEDEMDGEMSEDERDPMEDSEGSDEDEDDFDSEHSGSSDGDEDDDDEDVHEVDVLICYPPASAPALAAALLLTLAFYAQKRPPFAGCSWRRAS